MLTEQKEAYKKYKDDKEQLKKQTPPFPAKYKAELEGLKEVDSLTLANAQLNSYTTNVVNGNIIFLHDHIKLPKLKMVRIKQHREIPQEARIQSCTISMTPTGRYYVSILTEYKKEIVQKEVATVVELGFMMDYTLVLMMRKPVSKGTTSMIKAQ